MRWWCVRFGSYSHITSHHIKIRQKNWIRPIGNCREGNENTTREPWRVITKEILLLYAGRCCLFGLAMCTGGNERQNMSSTIIIWKNSYALKRRMCVRNGWMWRDFHLTIFIFDRFTRLEKAREGQTVCATTARKNYKHFVTKIWWHPKQMSTGCRQQESCRR